MKKKIKQFFVRSWWVAAFFFGCAILYEQGLKKRNALFLQLNDELHLLQKQKQEALSRQQELKREIESQSDMAWVEMTLMKELGLVPDGQQKVYFSQPSQSPLQHRESPLPSSDD